MLFRGFTGMGYGVRIYCYCNYINKQYLGDWISNSTIRIIYHHNLGWKKYPMHGDNDQNNILTTDSLLFLLELWVTLYTTEPTYLMLKCTIKYSSAKKGSWLIVDTIQETMNLLSNVISGGRLFHLKTNKFRAMNN